MWGLAKRWRWALGGGALLVVAGVVTAALWPSPAPTPYRPPTRARAYNALTFCLLTGPQGVANQSAAPVWSGVEAASRATSDQAEFLAASAPVETVSAVTPFVNSLVQQHCGVVIAVGPVEVASAQAVAAANTGIDFVLAGGGSAAANVSVVSDVSSGSVASAVEAYAKSN